MISSCGNCAARWAGSGATRVPGAASASGLMLMVAPGEAGSLPSSLSGLGHGLIVSYS